MRSTRVVPYDPVWPRVFEQERLRLEEALKPWLAAGVHHIGSTAVPGLAAKPIIDMIAGVRDLAESRDAAPVLEAMGYKYRQHRPEGHLFVQATKGIHLTEPESDLWRERFAFRDALREDVKLREQYATWKRTHAARDPAIGPYTSDKRAFVQSVLEGAEIDLKPDEERLTPAALRIKRQQRG